MAMPTPAHASPPPAEICAACEKPVDPLRAGHVALLGERFVYFCDRSCSEGYLRREPYHSMLTEQTREPPKVSPRLISHEVHPPRSERPRRPELIESPPPSSVIESRSLTPAPVSTRAIEPAPTPMLGVPREPVKRGRASIAPRAGGDSGWFGSLLTLGALGAALIGASTPGIGDRGAEVALGASLIALALELVVSAGRARASVRAIVRFLPLFAAIAVALYATLTAAGAPPLSMLRTVGLLTFGTIGAGAIAARLRQSVQAEARALTDGLHEDAEALPLPGDRLSLSAPALLSTDGVVVSGRGQVQPNITRATTFALEVDQPVFAGTKLVDGEIELRVTRTGSDRFLARLLGDGQLERLWPLRYRNVERALLASTALAVIVLGLFAMVSSDQPWEPLLEAATAGAVVAMLHRLELPHLLWARGVLRALEQGVVFPEFGLFERAALVEQVVLAGRGVVFAGQPRFVDIVWTSADQDRELVLAEVAGAQARSSHPLGSCLHQAIVAQGIIPGAMRKVEERPGLGVRARTQRNSDLVVGNRELLLRSAVSLAGVEARAEEYESERRELLFIARDGRLCAFAVFEDGLREGSFAAVQALLAGGFEPIMLSGSPLSVCQAAGRSLEIEHVRAEVLPDDRAAVVRSLTDGGRVVAMIGTTRDESAMVEADLALMLGGEPTGGPSFVCVPHAELEATAAVLVLARRVREVCAKLLASGVLMLVPVGLTTSFGLVSPVWLPIASFVVAGILLWIARNSLPKSISAG